MKFKLDENLGRRAQAILTDAGHDVMTVLDQRLGGAKDEALYSACVSEGRVLVTLDRDFGEVLRFPPEKTAGIVVLASRAHLTLESIHGRLYDLLAFIKFNDIAGTLCVVEAGRVRIHIGRGNS